MPEIKRHQTSAELSDWSDRLEAVAARAERLAAAPPAAVGLSERAALARDAYAVLWIALTPAVIGASCRISALLDEPLLTGVLPLDQQLLAARALRDAGGLDEGHEGGGEPELDVEPEPAPAEPGIEVEPELDVEPEPAPAEPEIEVEPELDVGPEPAPAEPGIEGEPSDPEWLSGPELADALGVSTGTVRSWTGKGWLTLGEHFVEDPKCRRRYRYQVERCRSAVETKSRKQVGREAQTPEGIEARRKLRLERSRARREAARNTEPVTAEPGGEPEPGGGGRLEQLLEALLVEIRRA